MRGIVVSAVFLMFACVHEEKEPESKLEYLNGEKYQFDSPASVMGIPVGGSLVRVQTQTTITGIASLPQSTELYRRPCKFATVTLSQNDVVVAKTATDEMGRFQIGGRLKNGHYRLRIENDQFFHNQDLMIESYKVGNLTIVMRPKL